MRSKYEASVGKTPLNEYDLSSLQQSLNFYGYEFVYKAETRSTMDDAANFSQQPRVILTDHQTQGRGRSGRNWYDSPGKSVLMTIAEPFNELDGDPPGSSQFPSQLFTLMVALSLQEAPGNTYIRVKWPNDIVYADSDQPETFGKKIGGILVENPDHSPSEPYAKLFGVGINMSYSAQEATHIQAEYGILSILDIAKKPVGRTEIVQAMVKNWSHVRSFLRELDNREKMELWSRVWEQYSALQGQAVRVTGLGERNEQQVVGIVKQTPFGNGILLNAHNGPQKVTEFNRETSIRLL